MSTAFSAVAGWAIRHARVVLAVAVIVALGAGAVATQLSTNAGTDTLVDRSSESYRATERVREVFGEEPVVVVAEGDLQELILTPNLGRLMRLEGCLSGNVPKGAKPIPGPCAELAELDPVQYLAGPGTFLNEAVIQIDEQLQRLAATVPPEQLREFLLQVAARYGITSAPSLGNPDFLASVVFDLGRGRGIPEAEARLPVPEPALDPDRPAAAARPQRRRTQPGAGADPRSGLRHDAAQGLRIQGQAGGLLRPARQGHLHDQRGAGGDRGDHRGIEGSAADPLRGRDRRSWR